MQGKALCIVCSEIAFGTSCSRISPTRSTRTSLRPWHTLTYRSWLCSRTSLCMVPRHSLVTGSHIRDCGFCRCASSTHNHIGPTLPSCSRHRSLGTGCQHNLLKKHSRHILTVTVIQSQKTVSVNLRSRPNCLACKGV